ncbi:MAG: glycosyltransferase [Acidobacteria bacterium]|nr:glycosyltransferase [Acidobacteriota bacterium]
MNYLNLILGTTLALIWLSRVRDAAHGMPTLADLSQPEWDRRPADGNGVAIIVPARNEQSSIQAALERLLTLDYRDYRVIAVDDRSSDDTGRLMDEFAASRPDRLKVIHLRELPPGWLGKTHAMWVAASQADTDWLLFTDADVMFRPDCLRRALAYAEAESADHLVILPRVVTSRPGEKMMVSFFHLLFVFGHRPWKVADPAARDHMGVGAFNLLRRSTYQAIGTHYALRFEVVDDMKLGKIVKNAGFRQRVALGDDLIEIRWARGARGVVHNLTKNLFAVLSFQTWRTLLACAAVAILNLAPFIGAIFAPGWARLPYAAALACIFSLYAGIWRQLEIHPLYFLLHPVATVLFIYTLARSMFLTLWRGGVEWRGTRYRLDELRKGLV